MTTPLPGGRYKYCITILDFVIFTKVIQNFDTGYITTTEIEMNIIHSEVAVSIWYIFTVIDSMT